MDAELKAKWMAALRDGAYRQGHGHLRCEDGAMCCLGVLLDLTGLGQWDGSFYSTGMSHLGGTGGSLNPEFREYFGLPTEMENTLIEMNDDAKRPFAKIADYIEANL